ncbi:MAG: hypothetical protein EU548_06055, partial [Promethearchaeota archaeon]
MAVNKKSKVIFCILLVALFITQIFQITIINTNLFNINNDNRISKNAINISNIDQNPLNPTYNDDVIIQSQITSSEDINTAQIIFKINDTPFSVNEMNLISGTLKNGIWEGLIDKQSYGTNITYYIYAKDNYNSKKVGPFNYSVSLISEMIEINITRNPKYPNSTDKVQFNISVYALKGVKNITLNYKTNQSQSPEFNSTQPNLIDGNSYNGIWNATIPSFPNDTIVKYYVNVSDNDNYQVFLPQYAPYNYFGYIVNGTDENAPFIIETNLSHQTPDYNNNVIISSSINMSEEISGLENVTLSYTVNNKNFVQEKMEFAEVESFKPNQSSGNLSNINILALKNKTWSGNKDYLGLYSFTNDSTGSDPTNWSVYEPASTTVQVISNQDGHRQVIEMTDNSLSDHPGINNSFSDMTSGIVEFWFGGDLSDTTYIQLRSNNTPVIDFRIYLDKIYYNYGGSDNYITDMNSNVWTNFRVKWNSSGWMLIINGTQSFGSGYSYNLKGSLGSGIDDLNFHQRSGASGYTVWIDAVDYSCASGYYEGRTLDYTFITEDHHWHDVFTKDGNYSLDQINISKVINNTSLADPYDLLLIGDHTLKEGWNTTEAQVIANIGKPIIARGRGGTEFIFALGLNYSSFSESGFQLQVFPSEVENHSVLNYPYDIPLSFLVDTLLRYSCKFNETDSNFETLGYATSISSTTANFGHYKHPLNDKILYWGFSWHFYYDYITTRNKEFNINMAEFLYNLSYFKPKFNYSILNFEFEMPKFSYNDTIHFNITSYDKEGNSMTSPTYNFTIGDYTSSDFIINQYPESPVNSNEVEINVTIEEPSNASGVKNATLYYKVIKSFNAGIESPHPTPNNYDANWTIIESNCEKIELYFDNITLEENFDFIYLYDYNDNLVNQCTGSYTNKKFIIEGNKTRIRLATDFIGESWGFSLSSIIFHYRESIVPLSLGPGNIFNGTWSTTIPKQNNITEVFYHCQIFDNALNEINSTARNYNQHERTSPNIIQISRDPDGNYLGLQDSPEIITRVSDDSGVSKTGVILQ